jgi:hypothetical protein
MLPQRYPSKDISRLTQEFLFETFITKSRGHFFHPAGFALTLGPRKARDYMALKPAIEYKYCMPLPILEKDGGAWHGTMCRYSTFKLLKLIMPFINDDNHWVQKTLRSTRPAKITLYACGAIEKSPDHGKGYRKILRDVLISTKTKIIDPCDFVYNKEYDTLSEHRDKNTTNEAYRFSSTVVDGDLDAVRDSDAIVVWLDPYLGSGSTGEMSVARVLGIPVYGIAAEGFDVEKLHPWLMGCVTRFFSDMNSFRQFVCDIE